MIPHAAIGFGSVTSGISQFVQPRFATCSSQASFATLPTP
jgi:hypothetical protein